MLAAFNFRIEQMHYVIAAMNAVPAFRPDQQSPARAASLVTESFEIRDTDYLPSGNAVAAARFAVIEKAKTGHDAAAGVLANMKSRYRKDPESLRAIEKLTLENPSPDGVKERMQQMSTLWAKLPVPSDSPLGAMAYVPWQGMNRAVFDEICATAAAAQSAVPELERRFLEAQERLSVQESLLGKFIDASCEQGRAQFAPGSAERALLDEIPQRPSAQPPGAGEIAHCELDKMGSAVLTFNAPHATSFILRHRMSGESSFHVWASGLISRTFTTRPLWVGDHEFDLLGYNSLGNGDPSSRVAVSV